MLCPLTIGQMWAGTKRIYCEYSAVSSWWGNDGRTATPYIYAWGGGKAAKKYTMVATGISNLVRCDIDDYHTDLLFYRSSSEDGDWDNQTTDIAINSDNRWSILDSETEGKKNVGSNQRYAPGTAIDGLVDIKNPHNQMFTNGEYSVTLEAHKTYEFKILETSTLYGLNDLIATSSISNQTLNTSGYQVRLCTAGTGTYTFAYNTTNHQLSITYPEALHPSIDYCYVIDYSWSPSANLHLWDGTSTKVAEWDGSSTVAGSTWPGAALSNKTTIGGQSYFYIAPGEFDYFMVSKNGHETDRTGEVQPSDGYSKRRYYNGSTWIWDTFTVRIQLENEDATSAGTEYQDIAFNSGVLSDITCPTKTHYDFQGYYTEDGGTGTQVIDKDGHWIASVTDYTDASKHWIHAGMSTTIYAKWTEHEYTITTAVSPAGAGSVSCGSSTTAKFVTASGDITATANDGWVFKEWQFSKTDEVYDAYAADDYNSYSNPVHINAVHNGTLTAVFEPRYYLVGKIWDDTADGGMPGWSNYNKPFKVVTTSPVLDTCKLTLSTNKTFYIMVRDKADGYSYGKEDSHLGDGDALSFTDKDNKVLFYSNGGTEYTFKITDVDGSGRPTVSVERPHQVYFGTGYAGIDNLSSVISGTTGGTLAVTTSAGSLSNEDWVTYGTNVTYTPSAATGYTFEGFYTSDAYSSRFTQDNPWVHYNINGDDHVYAKFEEKSTSVTLANDGNGHVTIGGNTETSTTCGVTTTRELTAVPNDGYMFSSWTKTSGDDITISSTSTNPTTLRGQGVGATSGQMVTANFTYRWALSAQSDGWGSSEFIIGNIATVSGDVVGYVDISLAANTNYQFTMKDLLTNDIYKNGSDKVYYMTNGNSSDWAFATDKNYNCGITTAGKGTYRFTWNVTDKTMTVTYPDSYQVNYGASVGGSVSVVDDDSNAVPNGGYVRSGGSVTYTATPNTGYTFVGWCVNDSYGDPFTTYNPWTNSSVAATSNAYAKFKSTNFVIYRSGDKDDDPRAALDDVESYGGGTISQAIEFRMKVRDLDMWYSLCLPFTVSAVKVWDEDDGAYYGIEPYYREKVGDQIHGGHYIIRTPRQTTNLPIAEFGDWRDPISPTGYVPTKDAPYIIQWHNSYFLNKYVSFFGATGQTIPTSFSAGTVPSSNDVINVCTNNSMTTGSVAGAYMLESDYGNGAWLRLDNAVESRPIPPFECYLLVNNPTRARYMAIRPGMTAADTPTGWDDVVNSEIKTHIIVYSISGVCVTQYSNCSINEAGQRLSESYGEGLYILRADNESVKLMVGGK